VMEQREDDGGGVRTQPLQEVSTILLLPHPHPHLLQCPYRGWDLNPRASLAKLVEEEPAAAAESMPSLSPAAEVVRLSSSDEPWIGIQISSGY